VNISIYCISVSSPEISTTGASVKDKGSEQFSFNNNAKIEDVPIEKLPN